MRISDWSSDVCSSDLQTVVEYAPSGGWYTEILAPLLHEKGTFYALQPTGRSLDGYKAFLAAKPDVYGKVKVVPFPDQTGLIPAGSELGRASCRERGFPYVLLSVVAVPLKKTSP